MGQPISFRCKYPLAREMGPHYNTSQSSTATHISTKVPRVQYLFPHTKKIDDNNRIPTLNRPTHDHHVTSAHFASDN